MGGWVGKLEWGWGHSVFVKRRREVGGEAVDRYQYKILYKPGHVCCILHS
jgi:hypothetical protein